MRGQPTGPVVVDLRAIQSPDHRGRGIGRYAYELALALERRRPGLVCRYLLADDWPPPGEAEPLLATGKVAYATAEDTLPGSARLFHSMSPFELGVPTSAIWPGSVEHRGLRYSATVYDLIPLRHPDLYLRDPRQRRRYRARTEVLRHADGILAISESARSDVIELLGVAEHRVTTVGTGVSQRLAPPASRSAAFEEARRVLPGLVDHFVLYPGGSDGRKNVEALVRAFSMISPELRAGYQLVVPCDLPPLAANHFRHVAATEGVGDRLLLPGYVSDDTLRLLYQATSLLCFPSLAEGFGLPVAEAAACGAVVVASDISPMAEMVVDGARFDPTDVRAIAAAIGRGLSDPELRARATSAPPPLDTWDDVADRAGEALDVLAAGGLRPWRRRPRLAFVSPFPPLASGVAAYSARLVEALADQLADVELDCFADGRDREPAEADLGGRQACDARSFEVLDRASGGYDAICYVLGNSQYHAAALAALRNRPGVVIAHDVRLLNLLRHSAGMRGAVPGGLEAAIRRAYGTALPEGLGRHDEVSADEQERYGLLMLRDVLVCAERLLVSSEAARRLAALDAGPALAGRLGVLPFALALPASELATVADARSRRAAVGSDRPCLVASFGIVDPSKAPFTLLEAVGHLGRTDRRRFELALVGPVSTKLRQALDRRAGELGAALRLTGVVSRQEYLSWLGRADIAVQLRTSFGGEASAAAGDCLAAGVPTVVSSIGWLGDLPDDVVVKVSRDAAPGALAELLSKLLGDAELRHRLSDAAARYAGEHTFARAAAALAGEVGLERRSKLTA